MKPRGTLTDRVLAKCIRSGDCLIWDGAKSGKGKAPAIHLDGVSVNVRVALWKQMGKRLAPFHTVKAKCGEPYCVAPEHLVPDRYLSVPKSAAAKAATAKAMRARSKLTEADVAEIRASEETIRECARRTGLSETSISEIRLYKTWRPTSNVFSQLIRP